MVLAHTLGVGGPDLELILLGGVLAVIGIVFFFQKALKPALSALLIVLGVAAGGFAFAVGGDQSSAQPEGGADPGGATVEIMSPADGDAIPAGQVVEIEYEVDPGELPPDQLGDMHVYIDGKLDSMQVQDVLTVEIPSGTHTLGVEAAQPNHSSFDPPIIDEIEVTGE